MADRKSRSKKDPKKMAVNRNDSVEQKPPVQKRGNNTGRPDQLKTGEENLSGYFMDDVKVHYNSNKPAQTKTRAIKANKRLYYASSPKLSQPN